MRRFQVPSLTPPVVLSPKTSHHLLRVLRIGRNERFVVFDGNGLECTARIKAVEHGIATVQLLEAPTQAPQHQTTHVLIGLPKHAAMDRAIRMATENGVTDLHPFVAERSAARGDRMKRWVTIADAAAAQCGRSDRMTIHSVGTLQSQRARLSDATCGFIALPLYDNHRIEQTAHPRAIVVGPEGGLTQAEVTYCLNEGFEATGLGRWTLRTDTAVAVASHWLQQ